MAFLFTYVWLRAALPRMRYDQLMTLGWKYLIPISLAWLLIVAGVVTWHWWGLLVVVAVVLLGFVVVRVFAVGQERDAAGQSILPPSGLRLRPVRPVRSAGDIVVLGTSGERGDATLPGGDGEDDR